MKPSWVVILLFVIFSIHSFAMSSDDDPSQQIDTISIDVEDKKFSAVLEQISDDTGYDFLIDEQLADIPITIRILNETVDSTLNRLLRGQNYAIIWDETNKLISISIYGKNNVKWSSITSSSSKIPKPRPAIDPALPGFKPNFDQATSTLNQ